MSSFKFRDAGLRWRAAVMVSAALAGALSVVAAPSHASAQSIASATTYPFGTFKQFDNFPSRLVTPRNVVVWLPPEYSGSNDRYPVLYVQDGQNVFDASKAYGGVEWGLDEAMSRLIATKRIKPAIVVAIWNSPKRFQEFMPQKAVSTSGDIATGIPGMATVPGPIISDAYLRFMTTELKPFIDQTFRTESDREHTFLMGSSMGGLISLYAMNEVPGVYGGAACLSTHWPAANGATIEYLKRGVAKPSEHKIYFDMGTATLDTLYAPFQEQVDRIMRLARYVDGKNFSTRVFEGADHSERSWRARVDQPLIFLLKR